MGEWWTYRLSNFLMFSPNAYARLLELYNRDVWPLHVATVALGGWILFLLWRRRNGGRAAALILAVLWAWVGWAFHLQRYRTIFPAAAWFAALFAAEAVLLVRIAVIRKHPASERPAPSLATLLFAFAWLVQPFLGLLVGRAPAELEVFGIAPDPTVAGTFAVALMLGERPAVSVLIIPLLWAAISGATLWAMRSPLAPLLPAIAVLAVAAAMRRPRRARA